MHLMPLFFISPESSGQSFHSSIAEKGKKKGSQEFHRVLCCWDFQIILFPKYLFCCHSALIPRMKLPVWESDTWWVRAGVRWGHIRTWERSLWSQFSWMKDSEPEGGQFRSHRYSGVGGCLQGWHGVCFLLVGGWWLGWSRWAVVAGMLVNMFLIYKKLFVTVTQMGLIKWI